MSTVYLRVEVDRTDGKFVSGELIGDELVAAIEGESLQVEDSEYEVTTVEVVPQPKKTGEGTAVGDMLMALRDAYTRARPIDITGEGDRRPLAEVNAAETHLNQVLIGVLFDDSVAKLIQAAMMRQAKKTASEVKR